MRFLHIADVHLDTSFTGRSEAVRRQLREAARGAFRRAVDVAIREEVQALLVAGDLFDGDRLSFQTERFLLEQATRLGDHDITVVYATGNHDPGSLDRGPRRLPWPANVRVAADATPQRFLIADRTGAPVGHVSAIGHATSEVSEDLSRRLPRPKGDLPEVALLHTQVRTSLGAADHGAYAPSDLTYLRHAGFDYWALGHVHVRQQLCEDPPIWYPGSPQGKTNADTGERGGLLVDLSDRLAPSVTFRPLAGVRWETLEVDRLDDVGTLDELERTIHFAWEARREADSGSDAEWMARVVLSGPCPLWSELRRGEEVEMLGRELRDILGAIDVTVLADAVHPVFPIEEHRARTDVLGQALRMVDRLGRGESILDVDASELVGAPSDDPLAIEAYVRRLLADAEGEVAARLLASGDS
ncbi:MAG: DNA repair exonuclease [Gemmatimonadetes bacterium]|nr:DNA repair exonuclease [Gemmatimonadota bacterium]